MDHEIIHGQDSQGHNVEITIADASILIGMRRTRLHAEASGIDEDVDHQFLRFLYCDVMAATWAARREVITPPTGEGGPAAEEGAEPIREWLDLPWPCCTFEEFLTWPDQFGAELERATYAHNPHWRIVAKNPKG